MEVPLSADLPPGTEPPAHMAYAANPSPNYASNFNHPPYAEMITAAIEAMKEKEGSSRQAIAKYIESSYQNLSPSHATLLTQQLKRMKNSGQLVMVKHSYMLPGSVGSIPLPVSATAGNSNININFSSGGAFGNIQVSQQPSSDGPKRKPGRPPKIRPEIQPNGGVGVGVGGFENGYAPVGFGTGYQQPQQPQQYQQPEQPQFGFVGGPQTTGSQFGFTGFQTVDPGQYGGGPLAGFAAFGPGPVNTFSQFGQTGGHVNTFPNFGQQQPQQQQFGGLANAGPTFDPVGAVPTVVPIAPVDGKTAPPAKRRGRPPKEVKSAVSRTEPVGQLTVAVAPVNVVQSTVAKRRGRPVKVNGGPRPVGMRGRGRPKMVPVLNGGVQKRGRGRPPLGGKRPGRPRKNVALDGAVVSTVAYTGKPRGRPRKNVALNGVGSVGPVDGATATGGGGVLPVKLAGRSARTDLEKKPRKLSGKPLGRPKKNVSLAEIEASNDQQLTAYHDLKARVEHFQSRIKQAVSVVKPYLNAETAVIAVGALQELEELASLDISTPKTAQSTEVAIQSEPLTVQSAPLTDQTAALTDQVASLTAHGEEVSIQGVEPLQN